MATERLNQATVSVLVLAGGTSTRMGADKALVQIAGEAMLSRVLRATAHVGPTTIVGGDPGLVDEVRTGGSAQARRPIEHLRDENPGAGPFAALVSALGHVDTSEAVVVSCDLAYPNPADIDLLIAARRSGDSDISVPLVEGERQWHAVALATRVTPMLRRARDSGIRSLRRGFNSCSETVVCSTTPGFFRDVDTPGELDDVRAAVDRSNDLR